MADSINSKAKEYYDNDDTGGSLNSNLKDFLVQQGATGKSINTLWRSYAYGEGGTSLNTRLRNLWGTSGSLMKRWKDTLGLTWDEVKAFFNFRDTNPDFLLDGSTSFDGTDDYIACGSDSSLDNIFAGGGTVSAWIKADGWGESDTGRIITKSNSNDIGWNIFIENGGRLYFRSDWSTSDLLRYATSTITLGQWYHIAITYDSTASAGTDPVIYVDGVSKALSGTASAGTVVDDSSSNLEIGHRAGGNDREFDGKIANVGIWNRALSASEVESIQWRGFYSELQNTELTNLVSWYDLQGDVLDKQGSNDGTNNGATLNSDSYSGESPFKPRIQDKAAPKMAVQLADGSTSFGNDDKIDLGTNTFNIGKDGYSYSIGAWFKAPDQDDNSGIFSSQTSSSNEFQILLLATGRVQTHVYDGSTQGTVTTGTDDEYNDNQWHHVVSVLDSSADTLSLYVDGSLIGSATWDEYTTGSLVAQIGARFASSNYFNGSIANVSIHSSALTQSQIQELMFTEKYSGLSSDLKTNLVSWYDLGSSSNPHNDLEGSNHGTNNGATVNTGYTYSPHGVVDPLNFGEVYSGRALDFDGTNDYVSVPDDNSLEFGTSDFSFSFWMNLDDVSGTQTIFNRRLNSSNSNWVQVKNTGTLDFGASWSGSSVIRSQINSAIVSANQWYHIAWSVDRDSTTKIYINGVSQTLDTNTKDDGANNLDFGVDALIGAFDYASPSNFFDGELNSLKVFNIALSESQVQELYTKPETVLPTGVSASNLKLDLPMQEGSGSYIYDGSGNQNHGTISGATWVTGEEYGYQASLVRSNTPMIFDGSNDIVELGTGLFNGGESQLTISAWAKPETNSGHGKIITKKGTVNPRVFYLSVNGTDKNVYFFLTSTNYRYFYTANDSITVGEWVHIVATYNFATDTGKIYLNGAEVSTSSAGSTPDTSIGSNSIPTTIGRDGGSSADYFKGLINDVGIWDIALDSDSVTALYNSGVPLLPTSDSGNYDNSDDLQGYWRNDGITTWTDRSTNSNNGTASGSPVSIVIPEGSTEGRDNQGYYLSDTTTISNGVRLYGGGEYIEIQDSEVLSFGDGTDDTPFSIESWVKMEDATNFTIASKGTYNTDCEYILKCETDKLYFYITDESVTNTYEAVYYNTALTSYEGQWIHLTATYDGRGGTSANLGMKLYLNGSVLTTVADDSGTYVAMENLSAPVYVGRYSSNYSNGLIDEVRIYSKALSASEVLKNYNSGKSSH